MAKKTFFSCINPPPTLHEVIPTESKVETAGYISAEKRITNLINAGQRLADYRKLHYDANAGSDLDDDDLEIDPTRKPGMDMADASMLLNASRERIKDALKGPKKGGGTPTPSDFDKDPPIANGDKEAPTK